MNKQKQKRGMNTFVRGFRKQLQTDKWYEGRFDIQEIQMGVGADELVFKRYVFTYKGDSGLIKKETKWVNQLDIARTLLGDYNNFIQLDCGYNGPRSPKQLYLYITYAIIILQKGN